MVMVIVFLEATYVMIMMIVETTVTKSKDVTIHVWACI